MITNVSTIGIYVPYILYIFIFKLDIIPFEHVPIVPNVTDNALSSIV